jgi:hypothetical protein
VQLLLKQCNISMLEDREQITGSKFNLLYCEGE